MDYPLTSSLPVDYGPLVWIMPVGFSRSQSALIARNKVVFILKNSRVHVGTSLPKLAPKSQNHKSRITHVDGGLWIMMDCGLSIMDRKS